MANALDWLQSRDTKINQADFDKYFLKYGDTSPLENVFTPAQKEAVANFNANRRSPGMAEDVIPGVEKTVIPQLDASQFSMPVGRGSWFNRPQEPASLQTYLRRAEMQEAMRMKESEAIAKYILNTPELAGRSPEEFTTFKQAQDEADKIRKNKANPLKEAKAKADLRAAEGRAEKLEKENKIAGMLAGDGGTVAPNVTPKLSPQDKQAFEWAKAHPNDSRASGIMLKLKQKGL
jgi:hypothetical protein